MQTYSVLFSAVICFALMAGACAPASPTPASLSTSDPQPWQAELEEYLTRLSEIGFSGSVLVAQQGEIVLSQGYGLLDKQGTEGITPETIFAIGSNTKPFTAAAVLKLQDQGRLKVTDPLSRFLPNAPEEKSEITLHQLMTHSSGLDHSGAFRSDFENVSREDAVARILAMPLLFKPGTGSSYSDYGFILLAAIVEMASGKPYQEYLRTEIFEPADMPHTGWWGKDPILKDQPIAIGYSSNQTRQSLANLPGPYWSIMGAGGMVSTVHDLYRWHAALEQGKILTAESLEAFSSVQFRMDERGGEGYGWIVVDEPGRRFRASAGGNAEIGHNNVMRWQMDEDLFIVASSSNDKIKAEDIVPNLARIAFGRPYQMPPNVVVLEPSLLDNYVGQYQLTAGNTLIVSRNGNELLLTGEGQEAFDLLFQSETGIDVEAAQSAVVKYLNSSADSQVVQWKTRMSETLGEFKELNVIGTAAPFGNGEPWTYISFEFERGNALTRWIVSPAGALEAAILETEPPYVIFLPESEHQFAPFSLSAQPSVRGIEFSTEEDGHVKMMISVPDGQVLATKIISESS